MVFIIDDNLEVSEIVKLYAEKITAFLILNGQIDYTEYDMYIYAFETLIAFTVNIVAILILGFICNKFICTLLFLAFYCPIRQFAGGYHADNYKKCLFVFILIYLVDMIVLNGLIYLNRTDLIIITTFISYIGVWKLAPIEHRNNPLNYKEKNKYKKIVRCLISLVLIIVLIGININVTHEYSIYLSSVITIIFIMLILAIVKTKRGL
ncbi:accessory gene regulator ArgB-like protein [Paraclostridium sordellii]|uniref:Accessory gene regulator protein B n=1 Tax=Paraclostridium sordellii TaxID=1505 RepID=A0A9P1L0M6_PARSO|nr:accessory gene regulator B family protein [Paeniclostridium sordellii]CEN31370.1 accessory gene regulator protein B [[Clostridium] sordellii] [Paeniclostridium sordellii]